MPMFDKEDRSGMIEYFRPDFYIDYKSEKGVFQVYNRETKEKVEQDSITFYAITILYKNQIGQEFTSAKATMGEIFSGVEYVDDDFKFAGVKKAEKDSDGKFYVEGQRLNTRACIIAMLEDGSSAEVTVGGMPYYDLFVLNRDKTNKDTVDVVKGKVKLTLTKRQDAVVVGQGKKKKTIHMLDVVGTNDEPKDIDRAKEINTQIDNELEQRRAKRKGVTDVQNTTVQDITEDVELGSKDDEVDLSDIPY